MQDHNRFVVPGLKASLSGATAGLPETPISEVAMTVFGDPDVVPLWFGESDLVTPDFVRNAAAAGLQGGDTFYTWQRGIPELRRALSAYTERLYRIKCPIERLTVTTGGMQAILLTCLSLNLLDGILMVNLRLVDVVPANGSPLLLPLLLANATISACLATISGIIGASMIADTLDEQELDTGRRQEGVFSAALSFSGKVTSGIGVFAGGLILQYVIDFSTGARPTRLEPDLVFQLGLVAGVFVPLFHIIPILLIRRYDLTRERYASLRAALESRRAGEP